MSLDLSARSRPSTADDRPVDIISEGPTFARVCTADVAAGRDPVEPASLFYSLYQEDGSHPSPLGTYVVALTVYGTLSGTSPVGLPAPDGTAEETAATLQEAAHAAIFDDGWLPQAVDGAEDTGGADGSGGEGGDEGADGAVGGEDGTLDPSKGEAEVKDGCGSCSVTARGANWSVVALVFGAIAYRRRRSVESPSAR